MSDFSRLVKEYLDLDPSERRKKLAGVFQVSERTVERWISGVAVPLPGVRTEIEAYMRTHK